MSWLYFFTFLASPIEETLGIDPSEDLSFSSVRSSNLDDVLEVLTNSSSIIKIKCCENFTETNSTTCGKGKSCKNACPVQNEGYMRQEDISTVLQNKEEKERNWCNLFSNFRGTYQNADLSHCKHEFQNPETIKIQKKKIHEACQAGYTQHPNRKRRCFKSDKIM